MNSNPDRSGNETVVSDGQGSQRLLGDLRRRVLGWMLLVSLVPLIIMAAQGYHCAMQALSERAGIHLVNLAEERADVLRAWIGERVGTVRDLGVRADFRAEVEAMAEFPDPGFSEAVAEYLDATQEADPYFEYFVVYGEHQRPLTASSAGVPALRRGMTVPTDSPEEIRPFMKRDWADWAIDERSQDVYVIIAYPLPTGEWTGGVTGVLAGYLNLSESLAELLDARTVNGETVFFRAAASGSDLGSAPGSRFGATPPFALPEPLHNLEGLQGVGRSVDGQGRTMITGTALIDDPRFHMGPLQVIAEAEEAQALAWLARLRFRATVTGAITLVVLVLFALWISDRLGTPLAELARVANLIRHGHVEERLELMHGAEAEEVGRAVNQMLDELQEQQKALVRNATLASVGELSSSVVHEIRNPLSSIKLNLQGLERSVQDNPHDKELAEIASQQVRRVEGMLDDLLQYGKPVELNREPTSFKELADAALAVVYDQAKTKEVEIDLADDLLGSSLMVDREQMCRALTNLLLNAIQASPRGASITLRARKDSLLEGRACLDVVDSGEGFSEDAEADLFKPFFTTKADGTGLGLANVKKIMELHGGAATAANGTDGGAVFTLELPPERNA